MRTWTNQAVAYKKALQYVEGRMKGVIKSFRTPWEKVNRVGIQGFEWNSLTTIAGESGSYKTMLCDQIAREGNRRNPDSYFRILMLQLEMPERVSKVREFSAVLGKSYQAVCSADGSNLSDSELKKICDYAVEQVEVNANIDIFKDQCTTDEFRRVVETYMNAYAETDEKTGEKTYMKTVITLDHAYLLKCSNSQQKVNMLYDFGETLVQLKKMYPIAFIILNQLQKGLDEPDRCRNGNASNYPTRDDLFGGDALYQCSDIVIAVDCPAKRHITLYGPERFIINGDTKILAFHFLKVRNGEPCMTFFRAEPEKMRIVESEPPKTQEQ